MKKVYLGLAFLLAGSVFVNAQSPFGNTDNSSLKVEHVPLSTIKHPPLTQSSTSRWYDYYNQKDNANGTIPANRTLVRTYLFPDSIPRVAYGPIATPTYGGPSFHNVAVVCDPTEVNVFNNPFIVNQGELKIRPTDTYTADSIFMFFAYYRYDQTKNDTLEITVNVNATSANLVPQAIGTPSLVAPYSSVNAATDTVFFKRVPYLGGAVNSMNLGAPSQVITVILDSAFAADSAFQFIGTPEAGGYNLFRSLSLLPQVTAGKNVVASVKFKPGYTYTGNDTLNGNKNYISVYAYKEFANTVPKIWERDYNHSNYAVSDVKYDPTWTIFAPRYAFTPAFQFDNFWMAFKLSCNSCDAISTNDIDANVSKLGLAYPNPVEISEDLTIPFSLSKGGDATVRIFNTIGQEVKVVNAKDLILGINKITVNTTNMNAGVYLYSLELDGRITGTQRFTVY